MCGEMLYLQEELECTLLWRCVGDLTRACTEHFEIMLREKVTTSC